MRLIITNQEEKKKEQTTCPRKNIGTKTIIELA